MLPLLLACHAPEPTPEADWASEVLTPDPWLAVADGYAVGQRGRVVDTATWDTLTESGPELYAVTARDGAVVGLTDEAVATWDGAWSSLPFPEGWGYADDVVVHVDGSITLLRSHTDCDDCKGAIVHNDVATWRGGAWSITEPPLADVSLRRLAELADGTLVAAGIGGVGWWEAGSWTIEALPGLYAYDLAADGDQLLIAGESGVVVTGTQGALTTATVDDPDLTAAAWIDGAPWVVGASAWSGASPDGPWTALPLPAGTWTGIGATAAGLAVLGDDLGPVALVDEELTEAWREVAPPTDAVWVDPDGTAWTAGDHAVGRWSATRTAWSVPGSLRAIDGASATDVVAVGDDGFAEWDGTAWAWTPSPADHLWWDVAVAPDGAAFAVGTRQDSEEGSPAFARRTATGWETSYDAPSSWGLLAVTAFAADDVYAIGWAGQALLHWDGATWTTLAEDLTGGPALLWGRSGDDLYLGGEGLFLWDGASVTPVDGAPPDVRDLTGDADHLLVSGSDGWPDEYRPLVTELRDGEWTEQLRADDGFAVGVGGGVEVATAGWQGWRRGP